MPIEYPLANIMSFVGYAPDAVPLRLIHRQEISRTAGGALTGKDLGPALWFGEFTTVAMEFDQALEFEAMIDSLDGVLGTFEAGDMRRPYPRAHMDGAFEDSGRLIAAAGTSAQLGGLAQGLKLSAGDYLSFDGVEGRALHRVMQAAEVGSDGKTPLFEVRPEIRPVDLEASPAVTLKRPMGIFRMVPGSVQPTMQGALLSAISFQAIQVV